MKLALIKPFYLSTPPRPSRARSKSADAGLSSWQFHRTANGDNKYLFHVCSSRTGIEYYKDFTTFVRCPLMERLGGDRVRSSAALVHRTSFSPPSALDIQADIGLPL